MPGSITPLPVLDEPIPEEELAALPKRNVPESLVVRYGYQRRMAELPYRGETRPGCSSKVVVRTDRGIELAEVVTTTCPNAGCGSSVTRDQMYDYIKNSGGRDYPLLTEGKVLRIAGSDDLAEQERLDAGKSEVIAKAKALIAELQLEMRLVEVERLLGGERILFYFTAENWVDFRELVKRLASEYQTRIEMCQVNAREEARIVADYEKCGQHCCCKQFLKVLKPVSMRSAKVQKATLDPQKISGRCGRLMCCLRYEDQTYDQLKKNLPHRKTPVMTEDGLGLVVNTQILTQLVSVALEDMPKTQAYPLEDIEILTEKQAAKLREERGVAQAQQQSSSRSHKRNSSDKSPPDSQPRNADGKAKAQDASSAGNSSEGKKRKRRRRKRKRKPSDGNEN